jgi:antitoxin MazE
LHEQCNYIIITLFVGYAQWGSDMAQLIKIGNSQGIRIPKPLIKQANIEGKELEIQVVNQGILVTPSKKPREGWTEAIEISLASNGPEISDNEWLDATLTDDDLEW